MKHLHKYKLFESQFTIDNNNRYKELSEFLQNEILDEYDIYQNQEESFFNKRQFFWRFTNKWTNDIIISSIKVYCPIEVIDYIISNKSRFESIYGYVYRVSEPIYSGNSISVFITIHYYV